MLLKGKLQVDAENLTLRYHSDRPPSQWTVQKLILAASRARDAVPLARQRLENAYSRLTRVNAGSLVEKALVRHFAITLLGREVLSQTDWARNNKYIPKVIKKLRDIETGLGGRLTISDILSPSKWDIHKHYADADLGPMAGGKPASLGPIPYQKIPGPFRPGFDKDDRPSALGYVTTKKGHGDRGKFDPLPEDPSLTSSIHLNFALVETCSTWANVMVLVHEASHKFAGTVDYAPAETNDYYDSVENNRYVFRPDQTSDNADSYAFFCISLAMNRLVMDSRDLFTTTAAEPPDPGAAPPPPVPE